VIAKTLMDLNLYRSDLGMLVVAAAVFNDLVGWIIFAVILGMLGTGPDQALGIGQTIALTLLFALFMLTAARWLINRRFPGFMPMPAGPAGSSVLPWRCAGRCRVLPSGSASTPFSVLSWPGGAR